jgi:anti-sigma factor RsiW
MICAEVRTWLGPYLDGELDLARHVEVEEHLRTCEVCARAHAAQTVLRSAIRSELPYFRASADLERRVRGAVRRSESGASLSRRLAPGWMAAAAAAAVAVVAAIGAPLLSRHSPAEETASDVVSGHVRSLMPGHLTDVLSNDQHTVKPWFAGKLDFSPPVADLSAAGFPLVGGRLDYAAGRPVAALVYRRGAHVINLFVWPSPSARDGGEVAEGRQGYNLVHWTRGQASFWAISDLNLTELRQFTSLLRSGGGR